MKFVLVGLVLVLGVMVAARFAAPSAKQATVPVRDAAPELTKGEWIGGEGVAFKGKVTVLHFWTFACINCQHNLPYYEKWAAKYDPKEVQVVGVHTPELEVEKDPRNVRDAIKRLGIKYPVLIDGAGENWNNYRVEAWPTVFLIDKRGRVRASWAGELQWNGQNGFGELSQKIERLRQER